jgi:SWI/SNF-related matrix-associated actin-dependent regulator 1 of chromatin subfamily A
MTMTPMPTQLAGAEFLAARRRALLADSPRVGKTGAAILAADKIQAKRILVVTTASGRPVWRAAFASWSTVGRSVSVFGVDAPPHNSDVLIASWNGAQKLTPADGRTYDLIILDEDHLAKNPHSQRARAVYGWLHEDGRTLLASAGLIDPTARVWHLSGTPLPHDPGDTYMRLRASAPERLLAHPARGWPDVLTYEKFRKRYCIARHKQLSTGNWIEVIIGGRNENELYARMEGFFLRRTQADVGIRPSVYESMPLIVSAADRLEIAKNVDQARVLRAIETGDSSSDELTRLRHVTGKIKARAVVSAAKESFECGTDKLVIAYWHSEVGDMLHRGLEKFGVARVDGSTPVKIREAEAKRFERSDCRVFLAQILAAGEAIDLSAAAELWFAEVSFTPKDISQMAARITNVTQWRNTFVKICAIENSIDQAMIAVLCRLSTSIDKVIK